MARFPNSFAAACAPLVLIPFASVAHQSADCAALRTELLASSTAINQEAFDLLEKIVGDLADKAGEDPVMFDELVEALRTEVIMRQSMGIGLAVGMHCE